MSIDLKQTLLAIEAADKVQDYDTRTRLVYTALGLAAALKYECGIRFDKSETTPDPEDWPVVVIKLPTGEVAWHCASCKLVYDGHSTEVKYQRIRDFVDN